MDEKYKQFEKYDWTDVRWQAYHSELYPPPNYKQVLKFKRKWYRNNVDKDFDVSYEPGASSAAGSGDATAGGTTPDPAAGDSSQWTSMGFKAILCLMSYVTGLVLSFISILGIVSARLPIGILMFSFLLELLMKHKIKFSTEYLQNVMQEDVAMMPMMAMTVLLPGIHAAVYLVALVPFVITGVLSFAIICKSSPIIPTFIKGSMTALADVSTRYLLLQARADSEVMLGFVLIAGVFTQLNTVMHPLLYWNVMRMRYSMMPWTQASFRKIDGLLYPVLGKIPGISIVYSKFKNLLHGFADVTSQQAGAGGSGMGCAVQ